MPSKHPKRDDETWINRKFADLERRIRQLAGQTRARSTAIGEGGITVTEGGNITLEDGGDIVIDDGGDLTIKNGGVVNVENGGAFYLKGGTLYTINPATGQVYGFHGFIVNILDPDGQPQPGFAFYRASGDQSLGFAFYDPNPSDAEEGYAQSLHWFDSNGHLIFHDDPLGEGIDNPSLTLNQFPGGDGFGPDALQEIAETWTSLPVAPAGDWDRPIATSWGARLHPFIRVKASVIITNAPNIRVSITINETEVFTHTPTTSTFYEEDFDVSNIPFDSEIRVKFRVRRSDTDGTSGCWSRMYYALGLGRDST